MQSETWRVGVLFSQTGVTSAVERTQLAATMLAIEEINATGGVCGHRIEPIVYDPGSIPRRYRDFAEQLCDVDRVSVIFGCYMSSTRKAALPVIEARGALLFYPTLYEGFEYSRHCIYTGAAPNQNSVQLVNYITKNFGNRVFLIGSNYVYPYESNRIMADLFLQAGGKILDERYVSLDIDKADFAAAIRKIKVTKPDVIYSTVVGDGIAKFYEAYREAGFDPATTPIASLSTTEAEIAQMAPGVALGHITAAPYFGSLLNAANSAFATAYQRSHGKGLPLTACAEAAYFQVFLYAAGLQRSGSDRFADLLPHLHYAEYDAPQGRVKIERSNNHTHLWPRVGKVRADGQFDVVYDPGVRVSPDPYMLEYKLDSVLPDAIKRHH